MKKILFISPYSGRSGSEMYLYRLLKNYDCNQFQAMVVTEKDAPLFSSLQPKILYTSMENRSPIFALGKTIRTVSRKLRRQEKPSSFGIFIEEIHRNFQADEWVLNTIIMHKVIPSALRSGARITTIIHEIPSAYSFVSSQGMKSLITNSHQIIANSRLTCAAISTMGRNDVILQPGFFDAEQIETRHSRDKLRSALGIKPDEFVLIGSGSLDHNKGIELFMQISEAAVENSWKFIWLGGERKTGFNFYLDCYRKKLEKNGNLMFLGEKSEDYYEHLNIGDAFLLTSFNESFSLATLEAMALGKPVLVYDCGGVKDFVHEECGRVMETRDPKKWLDAIAWLQQNSEHFPAAKLKNMAAAYSAEKQIPILTALLTGSRAQNPN